MSMYVHFPQENLRFYIENWVLSFLSLLDSMGGNSRAPLVPGNQITRSNRHICRIHSILFTKI